MLKYLLNTFAIFVYGDCHFITQNSAIFMNKNCLCTRGRATKEQLVKSFILKRAPLPHHEKEVRFGDFSRHGECIENRIKSVEIPETPQRTSIVYNSLISNL